MKAKSLAIFGTASDVGKSVIATALCGIFTNMGIKTAPFKAQNMSNNSFVTTDGGEIGRAQAVQAFASKINPTRDMNPVLLKPQDDKTAQVILKGKPFKHASAYDYFKNTDFLFKEACKSLEKLQSEYELIVIEGAGSCAEVNLRDSDFVNFKTAKTAGANIILVADIDKGGVFAQIIGTLECLNKRERQMIKGFIINKFRGDLKLFQDGIDFIEKKTKLPVLGVVPYFSNIEIEYEDGLGKNFSIDTADIDKSKINIAVLRLPHISNFTDFLPFNLEERVRVVYLSKPVALNGYDAVFIPGSKSVISDLQWIKKRGWAQMIKDYYKSGGFVFGICGGYQMLGKTIEDSFLIESSLKKIAGLGLLDIKTTITKKKVVSNSKGIYIKDGINIRGYEVHMGKTEYKNETPNMKITERNSQKTDKYDGIFKDNIAGCYLHGLFDNYEFRHYFLEKIAKNKFRDKNRMNYEEYRQTQYELLSEHLVNSVDMDKIIKIAGV